jgi:hypothetical protein
MQKLFLSLFFITSALIFYSCQKEVDYALNQNNSNVTGDFRAKIEGSQWVANKAAVASRMAGVINITGLGTDRKLITITLTDSGVHRYILSDNTMNAAAYVDSTLPNTFAFTTNQGTYPTQAGGEVNITSIDTVNKKISGTFSFKAYRMMDDLQRTITEGSFTNISYATTLPPSSSTDTFKVKINGSSWTPGFVASVSTMGTLAVSGSDAAGVKSVGLTMPSTITPGTYTLDLFGAQYIGLYNPDSDPNHSQASTSGTLTILSHNTSTRRIRGTFSFHAEALLNPLLFSEITEGYFAVTYQ